MKPTTYSRRSQYFFNIVVISFFVGLIGAFLVLLELASEQRLFVRNSISEIKTLIDNGEQTGFEDFSSSELEYDSVSGIDTSIDDTSQDIDVLLNDLEGLKEFKDFDDLAF